MNNNNKLSNSTNSDNNDDSQLKNGDRFKADDEEDELLQEHTPLQIQQLPRTNTTNQHESDTRISSWAKFKLLLWKNWILQLRHPVQTVLEIFAPVAFSILLVIIRSLVDPEVFPEPTYYKPFDPTAIPKISPKMRISAESFSFVKDLSIAWSPNNAFLMGEIMAPTFGFIGIKLISYNNSQQMWNNLTQLNGMNKTLAGVMFPDSYADIDEFPQHINFSLVLPGESRLEGSGNRTEFVFSNWRTNLLYPLYPFAGPRARLANDGGYPPGYEQEGFLLLQHLITRAVIESIKRKNSMAIEWPEIKLQRYPYPEFIEDPLINVLAGFVSTIFLLSFVYTCINTVKTITTEKEKQLKEIMKIMGLPSWLHWTAWFIKIFMYVAIASALCTILVTTKWYPDKKNVAVFTYSSPTIIFFVLLMYMMATVTFCFMISVFFSSANKAAAVAGLVWFLGYTPFLFVQQRYDTLQHSSKILTSLFHNTAMAYSFNLIVRAEGSGEGMHWNNLFLQINNGDTLVLGEMIGMFILDTLLYLIIALYVEKIFPGKYGVPLPWYYPFTSKYWFGEKKVNAFENNFDTNVNTNYDIYEKEPTDLKAGIQIKNLTKVYGKGINKKTAVDNLNLNMYVDQITCLLGHNGAGKTTTMSMLTGMIPPTSGTATVNGYDIRTEVGYVRSSLGLCPQHNVLFNELTVEEHLYFFGRLKGVSKANIEKEISRYIELLQLVPKKNSKSSQLSGGMQRKLSVGIALCGGSKVVIFDEPTSGMDPSARRFLWDLLQKEKKGRTMVLSTHFMDEADLLGDRIAIMANSELQCCGSSFFLKKRYGAGYHLIMEKSPQCKPNDVTDMLREYIPELDIYTNIGSELTYILSENNISVFEEMLKRLETDGKQLGINNFGISLTTLEEVFMKVGDESKKLENSKEQNGEPANKPNDVALNLADETSRITGFHLLMIQFYAMLIKKIIVTYRSRMLLITQLIIPTAMLIIAILVIRNHKQQDSLPALALDIREYPGSISILNPNGTDENAINTTNSIESFFAYIKKPLNSIGSIDFEQYILKKSREMMKDVRNKYIVAITVLEGGNILGWFNNEAYHSPPIALNLAHNAFLRRIDPNRTITVYNKPLPFTLLTKIDKLVKANNLGFQLAFNLGFSMALVSSFYVLFYVKERVCKSKHIQFVSGVNIFTFWTSAYICDLITFLTTILFVIITLICFQEDGYKTPAQLGRLFLIFFLFGISMLPMMYLGSFLFSIPSTGFVRMVLLNILTGVAAFIVIEVLGSPSLGLKHVADTLEWIFMVIPHYSCSSSIRSTYKVYSQSTLCTFKCEDSNLPFKECMAQICKLIPKCCNLEENYFSWKAPGIGRQIFFFILTTCILFSILLLIEFEKFKYLMYWLKNKLRKQKLTPSENSEYLDDDVLTEKKRIERASQSEINEQGLVMRDVTKYYNKFLAVNQLSIGVNKYECFGLLGINGAGKTSTFKMLTGDETITYGDAWVNGINLKTNLKDAHKIIGYCPQFDALIDNMTGRETLRMFCYLRGINKIDIEDLVVKLATELDFLQHIDKRVEAYSGGNKRKLSTAVALVSNPSVIYLDEPTTGMDPATKRHLWNVLCNVRDSGRCVVLTSHSMEECEALCTKIAIMVNGQFQCLGSVQHLKNKFSCGYTLTVKARKTKSEDIVAGGRLSNVDNIIRYIEDTFKEAKLREEHNELLTFYIADKSLTWSKMFGLMEQAKQVLDFEDYSLGQSTLEQVFLSFTRTQREE